MASTSWKYNISINIQKQISIRLSILCIILSILIGVSISIICINYFSLDSVLIAAANNTMNCSSKKVSSEVGHYFKPLNDSAATAFQMINDGIIKPGYSREFFNFLRALITNDDNITGAFWGDIDGNMYWLNKKDNGGFVAWIVIHKQKIIEGLDTAQGKLRSVKELPFDGTDPRVRPWYQKAQIEKKLSWVVYEFLPVSGQEKSLGLTAAFPKYDSKGNLQGVFGLDMLVTAISKYVDAIKLTKNSFIFLCDEAGNIIGKRDKNMFGGNNDALPRIVDLNKSWIEKSFTIYMQDHQSPFIYWDGAKKYIAVYEKIAGIKSNYPWFVSIVTPLDDITRPLRQRVFISSILIGITIIIGVIFASIFSSSLGRPIMKLAQDANLICQLKLTEVKELFSWITEISEMESSFMRMKNALSSFQRYMPTALVKKLVASDKIAAVGGEVKELSLIFTDIKNFTPLSENINPQELMQYLSRYFQTITKIIIEMNGTVDKYTGDGVMAFWGAPVDDPEHALHTCQAVLQIKKALEQLNEEWRLENKPTVATCIGINTGNVIVGNVGSDDKLDYTALGDSVNLASRLEGLNRMYGTSILVSEFTYSKVKDKFKFRFLDKVAAKGKTQSTYIYELLGDVSVDPDLKLERYNSEFLAAFSCYEKGDWQTAIKLFEKLKEIYPEDKVIKIFVERCSTLTSNSPKKWDGVWKITEKQ